jgi:hypothetical protein
MMALRWLGGQASHGLTGDPALLDLFMLADPLVGAGFEVRRKSEVSHRAMMAAGARSTSEETGSAQSLARPGPAREKADP